MIQEPFAILYQHREALQEFANAHSSDVTGSDGKKCKRERHVSAHMKLLLEFLDVRPAAKKIRLERERHNRTRPVTTFEMLWMLFPPGTDVFYDSGPGIVSGFVVKKVSGGGLETSAAEPFAVAMWRLNYNGELIGRQMIYVFIQPFKGEKDISTLPVVPCDFYERDTPGEVSKKSISLRQKLVEYGDTFLKLTQRQCVQYSGETFTFPRRTLCESFCTHSVARQ